MWAAAAAEDEGGGEGGRGGGRSLKWQDCITSHRGNRRKARENGKLEKEGACCLYVRKFGAAFFFFFSSLIFPNWLKEGRPANEKTC